MSPQQTKATCRLCQGTFARRGLTRHLNACLARQKAGAGQSRRLYHVQVEGAHAPDYWLHLELPEDATFGALDAFLRGLWLECCGHMSAFEFGDREFLSASSRPSMWDDEDEENIHDLPMSAKLSKGLAFRYIYDFGSTTELALRVLGVREGVPIAAPIAILARNEPPHIPCDYCKKQDAVQVCPLCRWSDKAWACNKCKKKHDCGEDVWLPVVDSPRVGECGYDGGEEEDVALAMAQREMGPGAAVSPGGESRDFDGPIVEQEGKYGEVQKLLRKHMGHSPEDLDLALGIWQAYLEETQPRVRSAAAYAAAVAYVVALETDDYETTQGELAKRYKTTAASVSRIYREIGDALDLEWESGGWVLTTGFTEPVNVPGPRRGKIPAELLELADKLQLLGAFGFSEDDEDDEWDLYLDDEEEALLRSLPPVEETWIGGCYEMEVMVMSPFPAHPTVCLWTTPTGHPVVGQEMLFAEDSEDAAQELMDLLVRSMASGDAAPRGRRTKIQVADPEFVAPFREVFGPFGIEVSHGGERIINSICVLMEASVTGSTSPPTYERRVADDVDEPMLATLFSASAELYRQAPWRLLGDAQPLLVDLSSWGLGALCACLVGYGGMTEGLLLFDSLDAFEGFFRVASISERMGIRPRELGVEIRAINFESLAELPVEFRRESMSHGWELASADAYPNAQKIRQDMVELPLEADDLTALAACAAAVAAFTEAHGDHMKKVNEHMSDVDEQDIKLVRPLTMTTELAQFPGRPAVEIAHPHPLRFAGMKKAGYPMLS